MHTLSHYFANYTGDNSHTLPELAQQVAQSLIQHKWLLATAESCTGGGLAYTLTEIAGSSQWFDCAVVSYSNQAKQRLLNVKAETLQQFGAVSTETVSEMVNGILHNSRAQVAVALSGIAGPTGGSATKPVGTVFIGWGFPQTTPEVLRFQFQGDRAAVRQQAMQVALQGVLHGVNESAKI